MLRSLQSEILDALPAEDARAVHSRRDIRRINAWMGNAGILASMLRRQNKDIRACNHIVEIGAGDGTLLLNVLKRCGARRLDHCGKVTLVDQKNIVTAETRAAYAKFGWNCEVICADVFDWLDDAAMSRVDLVVANLFLHHFDEETLARLFAALAQRARCVIACEPRRSRLAVAASRMLWLIGCNDVTRHDAVVSVRAGFRGQELTELWPNHKGWKITERAKGLFSHAFFAQRLNRIECLE